MPKNCYCVGGRYRRVRRMMSDRLRAAREKAEKQEPEKNRNVNWSNEWLEMKHEIRSSLDFIPLRRDMHTQLKWEIALMRVYFVSIYVSSSVSCFLALARSFWSFFSFSELRIELWKHLLSCLLRDDSSLHAQQKATMTRRTTTEKKSFPSYSQVCSAFFSRCLDLFCSTAKNVSLSWMNAKWIYSFHGASRNVIASWAVVTSSGMLHKPLVIWRFGVVIKLIYSS
jgi:hypothetical protein